MKGKTVCFEKNKAVKNDEAKKAVKCAAAVLGGALIVFLDGSQLLADAFSALTPNEIPKLYVCASWGVESREDLIELNRWINRQIEINHFDHKPRSVEPDEETVQTYVSQCAKYRADILEPYAQKLGNCKIVCLAGDHMIYEQKPEQCTQLVKSFLDSLD